MRKRRNKLTAGRLREVLKYHPDSGVFVWRVDRGYRFKAGSVAGCIDPKGYTRIGVDGLQYMAHRLAWLYMTGEWPPAGFDPDHENQCPTDNRWINLRLASKTQNACNRGANRNNVAGFKGVYWHKKVGKWIAAIGVGGKNVHLGCFSSPEEAAAAYDKAALDMHGNFSHTNGR